MSKTHSRDPMPCEFCGAANAINNSHVVPNFVIRFLRDNSVDQALINSRQNQHFANQGEFKNWMITGPYLCQRCDNELFGGWENQFSQEVFSDPLAAKAEWIREESIKFIVSVCYRYAISSLIVDENPEHHPVCMLFRDLCKAALNDPSQVGQTLFIYPFIYRPIVDRCESPPGINHFLTMTFSDRIRLEGNGLPNHYVIQLPRMTFVFSESDFATTRLPGYSDLVDIRVGSVFDPVTANVEILDLFADLLNQGIEETMQHQSATGQWQRFVNEDDQRRFPNKSIYLAATADQELRDWQLGNC